MNIIYTGDVLRTNNGQLINVKWLKEYTYQAIKQVIPDVTFSILFEEMVNTNDDTQWINQFNVDTPSWHVDNILRYNKSDNIIISFEMPPNSYKKLTEMGYKVIDFNFHPLRFLNDLLFGVKTNIVDKIADTFLIHINEIENAAARFKAKHITGGLSKEGDKRIALLIGQTPVDASLIHNGKIVSFKDFDAGIISLRDEYDEVWLKPHPCQSDDELMQAYLRLEKFKLVGDNIYDLLSHPNVSCVLGISSSVLYEAKYFGKHSQSFIPLSYEHTPIYGLAPNMNSFWAFLFGNGSYDSYFSFEDKIQMISSQSTLRKTRGVYWGYPQ